MVKEILSSSRFGRSCADRQRGFEVQKEDT